jgi:hypothetical protein
VQQRVKVVDVVLLVVDLVALLVASAGVAGEHFTLGQVGARVGVKDIQSVPLRLRDQQGTSIPIEETDGVTGHVRVVVGTAETADYPGGGVDQRRIDAEPFGHTHPRAVDVQPDLQVLAVQPPIARTVSHLPDVRYLGDKLGPRASGAHPQQLAVRDHEVGVRDFAIWRSGAHVPARKVLLHRDIAPECLTRRAATLRTAQINWERTGGCPFSRKVLRALGAELGGSVLLRIRLLS